jgi:outer membrane immunogenic protein
MTTMTKRSSIALALALTAATGSVAAPAFAEETAPAYAISPTATLSTMSVMGDWNGFYVGGMLGTMAVEGSSTIGEDVSGMDYGVQAGYLYDTGMAVLGAEIQYVGTDVTDDSIGLNVDSVLRGKLRAGYNAGFWQPYAVLGVAQLTTSGAIDDSGSGYLYGIGADFMVRPNILAGVEALQHVFDDYAGSGIDVTATTLEARVSFKF